MNNDFSLVSIPRDVLCEIKHSDSVYTQHQYHRHNGYEIYMFLGGDAYFYINDKCFKLNVGDVVLLSPSTSHRIKSTNKSSISYERVVINIKQSTLDRLSTPSTDLAQCFYEHNGEPISLSKNEIEKLSDMSVKLKSALQSSEYGSDVEANSYLSLMLLYLHTLCKQYNMPNKNIMPKIIKDVMQYISTHISSDLSLFKLSEVFNYNPTYISSLFKKHTGLSYKEYVIDKRIETAKMLLTNGASVSEACLNSGFSDYSNFIRAFSKATGISPGKYAKSLK